MSHHTYVIRKDLISNENNKKKPLYGIDLVFQGQEKTFSLPGIFQNQKEAESFVSLCNREDLSPVHLLDVVEDFLSK